MAEQTNFVKHSLTQIRIFSFCLRKLILVGEKAKLATAPIDGVYIFDLNFANKNSIFKSLITKGEICFKKGARELKNIY